MINYDWENPQPSLWSSSTGIDEFQTVGLMHKHFSLPRVIDPDVCRPHLLEERVMNFRLKFLREELAELQKAYEENDLVEIADALVDICVVALGTAHLHDLPFEELFQEVMRTNMQKTRAETSEQSKRGSQLDLVKPAGWKPPAIGRILKGHGWGMYKADE